MNSQLSSCMVHVWLSMGKFFKSMGQESVSVSLENRSSSIIVYDMKRWYPRTLSHRQKGEWGTWLTTTCELHSTGYFLLMCHSNPFFEHSPYISGHNQAAQTSPTPVLPSIFLFHCPLYRLQKALTGADRHHVSLYGGLDIKIGWDTHITTISLKK